MSIRSLADNMELPPGPKAPLDTTSEGVGTYPYISPIYGDFKGFPPTILTSGTRDLFLSNTVRTHRKLRRAGVTAELNIYEGQSHAQYQFNANAPESREAFTDIAKFFDRHLAE